MPSSQHTCYNSTTKTVSCLARSLATGVCGPSGANVNDKCSGVLLIGHGTREASGTAAFLEMVEHLRQLLPDTPVEGAFLEFARPTIAQSVAQLAGQGASHIAAVPMFLSSFGHTSDDLPKAVAEATERHNKGSGFGVQGSARLMAARL